MGDAWTAVGAPTTIASTQRRKRRRRVIATGRQTIPGDPSFYAVDVTRRCVYRPCSRFYKYQKEFNRSASIFAFQLIVNRTREASLTR